ncbi:helix-turn-helix transcriptional regulator [Mycobacterium barrassiae]|uniref:helix-turn-helix transcriptional regulator n=1 Tax=Mycobacterium barrassiae TaxID=319709 RepID=UPI0027E25A41|nr:helix-turn-helix transcriptional regulator [Mycobacterium barrassiae]
MAYLAGVSVTWYTWLEQGRDVTASRQVIDSLAGALRLSHNEHVYLLALAGYGTPRSTEDPNSGTLPAHMRRLLDGLTDYPALAIAPDWTVLGWNAAYEALYPNVAAVPAADRNFLWLLCTDPYLREAMPDWELTVAYNVASFRAEVGSRLDEPPFADLISRLLMASEGFRTAWESFDIERLPSRERHFRHPEVGDLYMEQHTLAPTDDPNLRVVTFIPVADSDTVARLRRLMDEPALVSLRITNGAP